MQILTDSGASLEIGPAQAPLPDNTPEVQAIPAGGFTPAQVVQLEQVAAANPPLTPNPAELPPITAPAAGEPPPPTRGTEAVYVPLRGADAVDQLYASCDLYGIDPLAAAANALHEGAGGGIGDSGTAYGPWQIHATDGRLPQFAGRPRSDPAVQTWAWSAQGFDYAMRSMQAGGAGGLTGHAAVHAIVYGFEQPKDKAGADATRQAEYDRLDAMGLRVRDYLVGAFGGPAFGTSVAGAAVNVPATPAAQPYAPAGVAATWRTLVDVFRRDAPQLEHAIQGINADLIGVFRR